MTVAFDAATEASTFTTATPFTFDHTPTGTPRGILLEIDHGGTASDLINGTVSYGGVAMTRVATATDPTTEPGRGYLYFLGSGIPTGTQTVSISHTGSADVKHATVVSVTAAADTEIGSGGGIEESTANPLVILGNGDQSSLGFGIFYSGDTNIGANATLLTGMTAVSDHDFGNFSSRFDRQTTAATGPFTFGYTAGVDDVGLCAVSIIEQASGAYAKGGTAPFLQTQTTSFILMIQGQVVGMDLYMFVNSRDHASGTALPTCTDNGSNGWTLLGNTTDRKALVFWKKGAAADVGATVTVAGCVGSTTGGLLVVKGGLASGDPTTQLVFEDNASGDETHAGFTPTNAASVVVFGVFDVANDTNAVTDLAGATMGTLEPEFWERLSSGGNDCRITVTARTLASGATGNFTWTQADSTTKSVSFAVQPDGGGQTVGVSVASETEAAVAVASIKGTVLRAVNVVTETEAANAVGVLAVRSVTVGVATEIEAANAVTAVAGVRTISVGTATEVETANVVTAIGSQLIAVGVASETETANAIAVVAVRAVNVGTVSEAEAAQAVGATGAQNIGVGAGNESEILYPVGIKLGLVMAHKVRP